MFSSSRNPPNTPARPIGTPLGAPSSVASSMTSNGTKRRRVMLNSPLPAELKKDLKFSRTPASAFAAPTAETDNQQTPTPASVLQTPTRTAGSNTIATPGTAKQTPSGSGLGRFLQNRVQKRQSLSNLKNSISSLSRSRNGSVAGSEYGGFGGPRSSYGGYTGGMSPPERPLSSHRSSYGGIGGMSPPERPHSSASRRSFDNRSAYGGSVSRMSIGSTTSHRPYNPEESQKRTKSLVGFMDKLIGKAKGALVDNEELAREEQRRKEKEEVRKRLEEEERQRRDEIFRQIALEEEQERRSLQEEKERREAQIERQRLHIEAMKREEERLAAQAREEERAAQIERQRLHLARLQREEEQRLSAQTNDEERAAQIERQRLHIAGLQREEEERKTAEQQRNSEQVSEIIRSVMAQSEEEMKREEDSRLLTGILEAAARQSEQALAAQEDVDMDEAPSATAQETSVQEQARTPAPVRLTAPSGAVRTRAPSGISTPNGASTTAQVTSSIRLTASSTSRTSAAPSPAAASTTRTSVEVSKSEEITILSSDDEEDEEEDELSAPISAPIKRRDKYAPSEDEYSGEEEEGEYDEEEGVYDDEEGYQEYDEKGNPIPGVTGQEYDEDDYEEEEEEEVEEEQTAAKAKFSGAETEEIEQEGEGYEDEGDYDEDEEEEEGREQGDVDMIDREAEGGESEEEAEFTESEDEEEKKLVHGYIVDEDSDLEITGENIASEVEDEEGSEGEDEEEEGQELVEQGDSDEEMGEAGEEDGEEQEEGGAEPTAEPAESTIEKAAEPEEISKESEQPTTAPTEPIIPPTDEERGYDASDEPLDDLDVSAQQIPEMPDTHASFSALRRSDDTWSKRFVRLQPEDSYEYVPTERCSSVEPDDDTSTVVITAPPSFINTQGRFQNGFMRKDEDLEASLEMRLGEVKKEEGLKVVDDDVVEEDGQPGKEEALHAAATESLIQVEEEEAKQSVVEQQDFGVEELSRMPSNTDNSPPSPQLSPLKTAEGETIDEILEARVNEFERKSELANDDEAFIEEDPREGVEIHDDVDMEDADLAQDVGQEEEMKPVETKTDEEASFFKFHDSEKGSPRRSRRSSIAAERTRPTNLQPSVEEVIDEEDVQTAETASKTAEVSKPAAREVSVEAPSFVRAELDKETEPVPVRTEGFEFAFVDSITEAIDAEKSSPTDEDRPRFISPGPIPDVEEAEEVPYSETIQWKTKGSRSGQSSIHERTTEDDERSQIEIEEAAEDEADQKEGEESNSLVASEVEEPTDSEDEDGKPKYFAGMHSARTSVEPEHLDSIREESAESTPKATEENSASPIVEKEEKVEEVAAVFIDNTTDKVEDQSTPLDIQGEEAAAVLIDNTKSELSDVKMEEVDEEHEGEDTEEEQESSGSDVDDDGPRSDYSLPPSVETTPLRQLRSTFKRGREEMTTPKTPSRRSKRTKKTEEYSSPAIFSPNRSGVWSPEPQNEDDKLEQHQQDIVNVLTQSSPAPSTPSKTRRHTRHLSIQSQSSLNESPITAGKQLRDGKVIPPPPSLEIPVMDGKVLRDGKVVREASAPPAPLTDTDTEKKPLETKGIQLRDGKFIPPKPLSESFTSKRRPSTDLDAPLPIGVSSGEPLVPAHQSPPRTRARSKTPLPFTRAKTPLAETRPASKTDNVPANKSFEAAPVEEGKSLRSRKVPLKRKSTDEDVENEVIEVKTPKRAKRGRKEEKGREEEEEEEAGGSEGMTLRKSRRVKG